MGRFTQPDTIVPGAGNPQAFNRYAYVLNNPVNFVDPTGHVSRLSIARSYGFDSIEKFHKSDIWMNNIDNVKAIFKLLDEEIEYGDVIIYGLKKSGGGWKDLHRLMFVATETGGIALWDIDRRISYNLPVTLNYILENGTWAIFRPRNMTNDLAAEEFYFTGTESQEGAYYQLAGFSPSELGPYHAGAGGEWYEGNGESILSTPEWTWNDGLDAVFLTSGGVLGAGSCAIGPMCITAWTLWAGGLAKGVIDLSNADSYHPTLYSVPHGMYPGARLPRANTGWAVP